MLHIFRLHCWNQGKDSHIFRLHCWKQGAKYTNLSLDSNSEAGKYATSIMAFPTTIVLDRNGNIIGEPIMGGIDNDESYKQLMKTIDQILAADKN